MSRLETDVFPITNLHELKYRCRLYRIRGLAANDEEYDHNVQILTQKLTRHLRKPVMVIPRNGQPYLVVPEDASNPPSPFQLVRATAHLDVTDEFLTLDFENPTPETETLCAKFLQFTISGGLYNNSRYWQPGARHPFFERIAMLEKEGIAVYSGYIIRVVPTDQTKFGVCVDVTYKYVASNPLPARIPRKDIRRYKGSRYVYRFGNSWYEIKLHDHSGLNLKEQLIPDGNGKNISLYDYIQLKARKPLPPEVVKLDPESSAIQYMQGHEVRHAAAPLCYRIYDTSDARIQPLHRTTILPAHRRRGSIHAFVASELTHVHNNGLTVRVGPKPISIPKSFFMPPDLAFGNNTIYSVRATPHTTHVSLSQLGHARISALYDANIGPHVRKQLDRQYLIVPQSVIDSYGPAYFEDLKRAVRDIYPQEIPYDPILVPYNDRVDKTYAAQGRAILDAVDAAAREPGFGIVMIHETTDRRARQHDQLAAMLMHQLRKRSLYAAVTHTTVPQECYRLVHSSPNGPAYLPAREFRGKLNGYLRGVAINKVLLLNECWPFVLATPLHADLTITIDVQFHTACFTFMGKSGPDIRTELATSSLKEKLTKSLVKKILLEGLRKDEILPMKQIQNIVIQRDGCIYPPEMDGVHEAIDQLTRDGHLPAGIKPTFVEIHKNSAAPFRLFDVETKPSGHDFIDNPQLGSYMILNSRDGYICSTGREFLRQGTAKPLHVKYIAGQMPFIDVLEDIYAQACLPLTRPEDCSRYPFTLKLTDIRLTEHAGGYDEDALTFGEEDTEADEVPSETEEVEAHE